MKIKTYQPTDMSAEGCWFSVDIADDQGSEAVLSTIEAESKDCLPWTSDNLAECKRLAYLNAIYEAGKVLQELRDQAIALGYDASHFAVLTARLDSGNSLDATERAYRQGYIFHHSGQVHAVPPMTGGSK